MRLDKFIAEQTGLTRSQAAKALKSGVVSVNEEIEKRNREIDMDAIDAFLDMEDDNNKTLENDRRNDNYISEKDKAEERQRNIDSFIEGNFDNIRTSQKEEYEANRDKQIEEDDDIQRNVDSFLDGNYDKDDIDDFFDR